MKAYAFTPLPSLSPCSPFSTHCALPPACLSSQTNSALRSLTSYSIAPITPSLPAAACCLLALPHSALACLPSLCLFLLAWLASLLLCCSAASERLSRSPSAFLSGVYTNFRIVRLASPRSKELCRKRHVLLCERETARQAAQASSRFRATKDAAGVVVARW